MKQVILIGDSIRMGYQDAVGSILARTAEVWGPQENGGTSANVLTHLDEWALSRDPDVVHVNAGLHDLRKERGSGQARVPLDDYRANVAEIFGKLNDQTNAKVIWATTTPVNEQWHREQKDFDRFEADVVAYNAVAIEIARQAGAAINDLCTVMTQAGADAYLSPDGVHFNGPGYDILADAVADAARAVL